MALPPSPSVNNLSTLWPFVSFLLFYGIAILSYLSPGFRTASNAVLSATLSIALHAIVLGEAVVYLTLRTSVRLLEVALFPLAEPRPQRRMRRCLRAARSYGEWSLYATALDKLEGRSHHREDRSHNWTHIRELVERLQTSRNKNDVLLAAALVQQCAKRNVEGVLDEHLYAKTHAGTPPPLVTDFVREIVTTMEWLTEKAVVEHHGNHRNNNNNNSNGITFKSTVQETDMMRETYQEIMSIATLDSVRAIKQEDGKVRSDNVPQDRRRSSMEAIHHIQGDNTGGRSSIDATLLKEEMKQSLHRLRISYGRTALCLSGGAALTYFHAGHILGLLETNCLPNIVSGSSAGGLFAAAVCSKTDDELMEFLQPTVISRTLNAFEKPWLQRLNDIWNLGYMFAPQDSLKVVRFSIGPTGPGDNNMTFEEAFRRTGRVLCITLSPLCRSSPPVLLNYLTAPKVVISSAVIASCAAPGLIPSMRLRYKDSQGRIHDYEGVNQAYIDGSIRNDIPKDSLAEMLNVQFCIVAQVNPHILPFYNSETVGNPTEWGVGSRRGGFPLAALEFFLKVDMQSKLLFLDQMGASSCWTRCMTQLFGGSCTLIPDYKLSDIFGVISNPSEERMESMFQRGAIAAYRNATLIRTHYVVADAIESCLRKLDSDLHFTIPSGRPIIVLRENKIVKASARPPWNSTNTDSSKKSKTTKREAFFSSVVK